MMQLLLQSSYWGQLLIGKESNAASLHSHYWNAHHPLLSKYKFFAVQCWIASHKNCTDLENCNPNHQQQQQQRHQQQQQPVRFAGCCKYNHCERKIHLDEFHFLEFHPGAWDLYFTYSYSPAQGHTVANFVLVPHTASQHDKLVLYRHWTGWIWMGECQAATLRLDLEWLIRLNSKPGCVDGLCNEQHHYHLDIFMDTVWDRNATPISVKRNARANDCRRRRRKQKCLQKLPPISE